MNYATIKKFDIANGPGVRVSLFVSGCRHRCKNCFNSEAWDFHYGSVYNEAVEEDILSSCAQSYITGLSLLGGEPFEPENQPAVCALVKRFKERFPDKTVWCYTGFTFEDIAAGKVGNAQTVLEMLSEIDVCVDGKFVEEKKNLALLFRGSSNQRIIDVKKSIEKGSVVLLEGKWERTMGSGDINEI